MKKPAQLPFRGIATNAPFFNSGSPFCPPESMSNMLVFDATKDRPRMGSRPGVSEYFYGTLANGAPIRGCGLVSRGKTPTGYSLGAHTDLPNTNGGGHKQIAVTGNVWRVDSAWGLTAYDYEDVSSGGAYGDSGPSHAPVSVVSITPDQTRIIVGETYTDSSTFTVGRVTVRDASTLAVIWSKKLLTASQNRFVSAVCATSEWVFVATNHFVRIYKLSDGSDPAHGSNLNGLGGWSTICQDVKASADGGTLYALFLGTSLAPALAGVTAGQLPSGVAVTAGIQAQHFRSGIMKFNVASAAHIADLSIPQVLTQVAYSPQLDNTARYYEGVPSPSISHHNYLRFSEQMPWGPRGLSPVKMALRPLGGIVVIHANAAWGPNGTVGNADYYPPDGSAGRFNVTAFRDNGTVEWIADGDSIFVEDGGGGFFNDLLSTTGRCITIDSAGNVFIAGRRTIPIGDADGRTTFAFDQHGDFLADQDLGGTSTTDTNKLPTINSICIMPSSQNVVCGGVRNNNWAGASSAEAQLWQLANGDLTIRKNFPDLGNFAVNGVQGIGFDGPVPAGTDQDGLGFVTEWVG